MFKDLFVNEGKAVVYNAEHSSVEDAILEVNSMVIENNFSFDEDRLGSVFKTKIKNNKTEEFSIRLVQLVDGGKSYQPSNHKVLFDISREDKKYILKDVFSKIF